MLCASMDVIENSQSAIDDFYALPDFSANNGGYLYLYGLLQAFFVQQDALSCLNQSLCGIAINWEKSFPKIYSIRELRNETIGHPCNTNRKGIKSFHSISSFSINKTSFEFASYREDKGYIFEPKFIDLNDLRQTQEQTIITLLHEINEKLINELNEHKGKFKGMRLMALVPKDYGYSLSKVYEGIFSNYPLAGVCFDELERHYVKIKDGVTERYGNIDVLPNIKIIADKLDYIIDRLKEWIKAGELYGNKDAEVFLDGFKNCFNELKEYLQEIDNEFNEE